MSIPKMKNTIANELLRLYKSSHFHTIILFTWTDYKTVLMPITAFASATAPARSFSKLLQACIWIWIHMILCNVSNQAESEKEDAVNRPWRPIPSGRLTVSQALLLRSIIIIVCALWSAMYGNDLIIATLSLVAVTVLHDQVGLSNHPLGKNLCNVAGYACFEVGATKIMAFNRHLDHTSKAAIVLSSVIIFTTIQAQDFPDVEGDIASKRVTFPIYAPEFSRVFTFLIIPLWSFVVCWYWSIGWLAGTIYIGLGAYVGARYYCSRSQQADKDSYFIFNIWLTISHVLPFHARSGFLYF